MKKKIVHKAVACTMVGIVASLCAACGQKGNSKDLMVDIVPPKEMDMKPCLSNRFEESTADFSIKLFQSCIEKEENMMVSPVSMMLAMSMTAQGAKNNTLREMQQVMYGGAGEKESIAGLAALQKELFQGKDSPIKEGNSIWLRENSKMFSPSKDFLRKNKAYLGAEVYEAPFDGSTVKDINAWVSKKTDGQIDKLIKELGKDAVMHLINAVCFDGKWETPYEKEDVSEGEFRPVDGGSEHVEYLNSMEDKYIREENAEGVIKPYKDGYSFVAILPREGVSLSDYVKGMKGETFVKAIKEAKETRVETMIPKFKSEYCMQASEVLKKMGIKDAFDRDKADFTGMGSFDDNIFISSVLQKTFIQLDEEGTKASAVTDIEMKCTSAAKPEKIIKLEFTRPFLYAIINDKTSLPVFMGMMTRV